MAEQVIGERPVVEVGGEPSDEDSSDADSPTTRRRSSEDHTDNRQKSPPQGAEDTGRPGSDSESCGRLSCTGCMCMLQ